MILKSFLKIFLILFLISIALDSYSKGKNENFLNKIIKEHSLIAENVSNKEFKEITTFLKAKKIKFIFEKSIDAILIKGKIDSYDLRKIKTILGQPITAFDVFGDSSSGFITSNGEDISELQKIKLPQIFMINNYYFEADIELKKEEEIKNFIIENKYGDQIEAKINYDLIFEDKNSENNLEQSNYVSYEKKYYEGNNIYIREEKAKIKKLSGFVSYKIISNSNGASKFIKSELKNILKYNEKRDNIKILEK